MSDLEALLVYLRALVLVASQSPTIMNFVKAASAALATWLILCFAGSGHYQATIVVDAITVLTFANVGWLAWLLVRHVRVPQALLGLFTVCAVTLYIAIGAALTGSAAPDLLVAVAAVSIALCSALSIYTFIRMVQFTTPQPA